MKVLLGVVLMFMGEYLQAQCTKADIYVVADYSGSVAGNERNIVDALIVMGQSLNMAPGEIRIGVIAFNDVAYHVMPLTGNQVQFVSQMSEFNMVAADGTHMRFALNMALKELEENEREDPFVRKLIVVISDGEVYSRMLSIKFAQRAKDEGVAMFTIYTGESPRGYEPDVEFLKDIATSPEYYFDIQYGDLARTLKELDPCM
jgi:Mg-chelatase subunit ChlD